MYKVFDVKFPCVIIPHEWIPKSAAWLHVASCCLSETSSLTLGREVSQEVHRHVAKLMSWSMECALQGKGPHAGFHGEQFEENSLRQRLAGATLAKNWRRAVPCSSSFMNARRQHAAK